MTDGSFNTISFSIHDDVAYVNLENAPVNIMTGAMMDELSAILETVAVNPDLKAVAFTADGKAFCAGADVGEHKPDQAEAMIESFGRLFRKLDALEVPIVMAVNGAAMGAGFELILMADVLVAAEEATFGQPEIRLGFFAPVGVVELPARVGRAKAMEITCSGRSYSAGEMAQVGLVSQVVPGAELEAALEAVLKDFRRASPLVLRLNTRTLKGARSVDFAAALDEAERVFLEELMTSADPVEGIEAFYGKRRPEWKNA